MIALRRIGDTILVFAVALIAWQILYSTAGETALPGPVRTLRYLGSFLETDRFVENARSTLVCFGLAVLLSYAIGLSLGAWLGMHRLSGSVGEPLLISFYSLPKITLYPIVLLIFGLSVPGRITFGVMHGALPVALLTMNAIRTIPRVHLKSVKVMRLSKAQALLTILLPAALPEIVSGLRLGFSLTLLGVVLAEMFAAKHGLGFLIINAMQLLQGEEMLAVAFVLFAFALMANAILLSIEHRLHRRV